MKSTSLLLFFLFSIFAFSQDAGLKRDDWDTSIAFRGGIGVQKSVYAEFGISRFSLMEDGWVVLSKGYYTAVEAFPAINAGQSNVYGFKAGCEYSALFLSVGIEGKYQTDLQKNDFVLTPKVGLGAAGIVTFYYGYNISAHNEPFSRIGVHQFGLVCNLSKSLTSSVF